MTKNTLIVATLLSLLNRVEMLEQRHQNEAAEYGIDRVTNTASVTINPTLLDAEGQHKARIRGAVRLLLSGFRAYNRNMTRRYGEWPGEQIVFDRAHDEVSDRLEALFHEAYPFEQAEPIQLRDVTPATPSAPEQPAPAQDQPQVSGAQPTEGTAAALAEVERLEQATGINRTDLTPDDLAAEGQRGDLARAVANYGGTYIVPGDDQHAATPDGVTPPPEPTAPASATEGADSPVEAPVTPATAPDTTPTDAGLPAPDLSTAAPVEAAPADTMPSQSPAAPADTAPTSDAPAPISLDFTDTVTAPAADAPAEALPADATLTTPDTALTDTATDTTAQ